MLQLIKTNFARVIRKGTLPFAVLLIVVCSWMSVYDIWYQASDGEGRTAITLIYRMSYTAYGWFLPLLYAIASGFGMYQFCQEWKNSYWKPLEQRCGKQNYLTGTAWFCFWQSFLTMFIGQICYILLLLLMGRIYNLELYYLSDVMSWQNHPVLRMIFMSITISLFAGFWGMVSYLVAAWKMDCFMAIVIPLTLYLALEYLLQVFGLGVSLGMLANSDLTDNLIWDFPCAVVVLSGLSYFCGLAATVLVRKRIENEYYS